MFLHCGHFLGLTPAYHCLPVCFLAGDRVCWQSSSAYFWHVQVSESLLPASKDRRAVRACSAAERAARQCPVSPVLQSICHAISDSRYGPQLCNCAVSTCSLFTHTQCLCTCTSCAFWACNAGSTRHALALVDIEACSD